MPMTLSGTTGIALPSGANPAFSAYSNSNQSISGSTFTKILFQVEEYDTNSNFDTTNARFTPTIAGYYLITGNAYMGGQASQLVSVYKNGTEYKRGFQTSGGGYNYSTIVSVIVYCNGSTDYIELYGYQTSGAQTITADSVRTFFQACMIRSA